jgi:hypothetical protein
MKSRGNLLIRREGLWHQKMRKEAVGMCEGGFISEKRA